jgi:hypothetical protein
MTHLIGVIEHTNANRARSSRDALVQGQSTGPFASV